jgi:hypothetical protein
MEPKIALLSLVLLATASANTWASVAPPRSGVSSAEGGWATSAHAWWTDRQAGWIGGVTGSVVGVLGGLVGTLTGLGKARRLALGLAVGLIVFGAACLVVGVVGVVMSQPYAVYYPLLLIGLLCTLIFGINFPSIRRSYAERELRKMEALDR